MIPAGSRLAAVKDHLPGRVDKMVLGIAPHLRSGSEDPPTAAAPLGFVPEIGQAQLKVEGRIGNRAGVDQGRLNRRFLTSKEL